MIKEPYVHTIWCDDIRMEIGNKPSFMGVFTGGLLVPSLPVVLGKLGIQTWICTPLDRPPKKVSIELLRDDGTVIAAVLPEDISVPDQRHAEDATRSNVVVSLMVGPLEIPAACKWFMVRATLDGVPVDGPKLKVLASAEQFANLFPAPNSPAVVSAPGGAG